MNTSIFKKTAAGFALAALLGASAAVPASAAELLNSSYDVARELFTALNKPFIEEWDKAHPDDKLTIRQSHAGSSKQALAILQGQKADVVTFNQVTDIQVLHDKGKLQIGRRVCLTAARPGTRPWLFSSARVIPRTFRIGLISRVLM